MILDESRQHRLGQLDHQPSTGTGADLASGDLGVICSFGAGFFDRQRGRQTTPAQRLFRFSSMHLGDFVPWWFRFFLKQLDVRITQSPATRSHPLISTVPCCARRRRLGQDARDHAKIAYLIEDCGFSPRQHRRHHFHQQGGAGKCRSASRKLLQDNAGQGLTISTFHSLGVRILREEAQRARL